MKNSKEFKLSLLQRPRDLHETDVIASLRDPVVIARLGDQHARALLFCGVLSMVEVCW